MEFTIIIIVSYLLGSLPFGYVIAKYNGINIHEVGSGNIGTTNVWRTLGWKWGVLTFIADVSKGYVAVCFIDWFFFEPPVGYYILAGSLAVIGHFKPIWVGFKGGKIVATSLGVLIGLLPIWHILIIVGIFATVLGFTKYVSAASISAAWAAAVTKIIFGGGFNHQNYPMTIFVVGVAMLVMIAHKENIKRLLEGEERRI